MITKKQIGKISVKETPKTASKAAKTAKATLENPVPEPVKTAVPAKKSAAKMPATAAAKTSKVTFTLPREAVERAETVAVVGDFCNWDVTKAIALKKQKDGSFKTAVELESGREYQFRFLIDGEKWENAWDADAYEMTPFGVYNSVVKTK